MKCEKCGSEEDVHPFYPDASYRGTEFDPGARHLHCDACCMAEYEKIGQDVYAAQQAVKDEATDG